MPSLATLEPKNVYAQEKSPGYWVKTIYQPPYDAQEHSESGADFRFNANLILKQEHFDQLRDLLTAFRIKDDKTPGWFTASTEGLSDLELCKPTLSHIEENLAALPPQVHCYSGKNKSPYDTDDTLQMDIKWSSQERYPNSEYSKFGWILNIHIHPENSRKARELQRNHNKKVTSTQCIGSAAVQDLLRGQFDIFIKEYLKSSHILLGLSAENCDQHEFKLRPSTRGAGQSRARAQGSQFWRSAPPLPSAQEEAPAAAASGPIGAGAPPREPEAPNRGRYIPPHHRAQTPHSRTNPRSHLKRTTSVFEDEYGDDNSDVKSPSKKAHQDDKRKGPR